MQQPPSYPGSDPQQNYPGANPNYGYSQPTVPGYAPPAYPQGQNNMYPQVPNSSNPYPFNPNYAQAGFQQSSFPNPTPNPGFAPPPSNMFIINKYQSIMYTVYCLTLIYYSTLCACRYVIHF